MTHDEAMALLGREECYKAHNNWPLVEAAQTLRATIARLERERDQFSADKKALAVAIVEQCEMTIAQTVRAEKAEAEAARLREALVSLKQHFQFGQYEPDYKGLRVGAARCTPSVTREIARRVDAALAAKGEGKQARRTEGTEGLRDMEAEGR